MGFDSKPSGIAASIFLALYTIYLAFTLAIVFKKGIKSVYTMLLLFGVFRVVGQMSAVVFAKLGYEHWQWLIVYLVFSAEGYFILVLATFRFLTIAQKRRHGTSWIRPTPEERAKRKARATSLWQRYCSCSLSASFHMVLIPANALVVAGGSMLAGIDASQLAKEQSKVAASKGLRTSGQAIFLAETFVTVILLVYCMVKEDVRDHTTYLLCLASPFLLVRGIAGVLAIYIRQMNYYDMRNYTAEGLSSSFVVYEYTLTATMEFIVAVFLIANYYVESYRVKRGAVYDREELQDLKTSANLDSTSSKSG
ncbi:hypothetical protein JA9_003697 [Meyerozyma sp. JA9]|nr:hypothetical protein JA9_003697 [Meyerozyma sp. JA9]